MSTNGTNTSPSSTKVLASVAVALVVVGSVIGGVCGSGRCTARTSSAPSSADATALTASNGTSSESMAPSPPDITSSANATQSPAIVPAIGAVVTTPSPATNFPSSKPIGSSPATSSVDSSPSPQPLSPTNDPTRSPITEAPVPVPSNTPVTPAPVSDPPTNVPTVSPVTKAPTPGPSEAPTEAPISPNPTDAPVTLAPVDPPPTSDPSASPVNPPPPPPRITEGALVTNDCLFQNDYGYAIDIFWSCGDERFNEPLRLHTFKRHALAHQLVFADQHLTYDTNDSLLWFTQYNQPRCVRITGDDGEWFVTTNAAQCTAVRWVARDASSFWIQAMDTELCAATTACNDDASTGGSECGGIDHRFLPLRMDACTPGTALTFSFAEVADFCPNERPGNSCF